MSIKTLSVSEIELLIEQKLLELLGDPDSGLELREDFKKKLQNRIKKASERISHKEVVAKYG